MSDSADRDTRPPDGPGAPDSPGTPDGTSALVPRSVAVVAAWSWRFLVVAGAVYVAISALARIRLVLLPVFVALLLASVLVPVRRFLTDRGVARPLAMLGTVAVFFGMIAAVSLLIVPPLVNEFSDLDAALGEAVDDVEAWLVDGPLGLERAQVSDARDQLDQALSDVARSDGAVLDGVVLFGELFTAALLTLVITFFVVKDGERIQHFALARIPRRHRDRTRAAADAAWGALGGYLRASAMLGAFEGLVIGITLTLVGAELAVPVAALTFVAAFFPFVGAIAAGVIAVMVAFVTVGTSAAIVMAVVALVVQQLDNDVLAPLVFGKTLSLHPLVVVLVLSLGAALGGLTGAFLAIPVTAATLRVIVALGLDPATDLEPVAHADVGGA